MGIAVKGRNRSLGLLPHSSRGDRVGVLAAATIKATEAPCQGLIPWLDGQRDRKQFSVAVRQYYRSI